MNEKIKWLGYCRKSTEQDDRQTLSIEAQEREIKELANKQGIGDVRIISESKTAYKTGRQEFNRMISLIEEGTINAIIVYHLSRLARNTSDGGRLIYLMDEGKLHEIRTPTKTFTNNSDDKFILSIEFGMNKKSSDDTSQYVKRDIHSKLLKGEYPALAPIGYLNLDKDDKIVGKCFSTKKQILLEGYGRKLKRIERDPIIAPLIRKLFDLALSGNRNLRELCEDAQNLGITSKRFERKLGKSQVYKILTNRFYFGMIDYNNESHEGVQDPIISKDEYDRIQEILHSRSRPRPKGLEFAFSGQMKCGVCGMSIVAYTKVKPSGRSYTYYSCSKRCGNCGQPGIREEALQSQIEDKLKSITISERLWEVSLNLLKESYGAQIEAQVKAKKEWENRYRTIEMKLKRLLDLRIDGVLEDAEYKEKREELVMQKAKLEEMIAGANINSTEWLKRAENFFTDAKSIYQIFKTGDLKTKKATVARIGWNLTLKDQILHWNYKEPFHFLIEVPKLENLPSFSVGTLKNDLTTNKNTPISQGMSLWRARRDSNPRSSP